MALRIILDTNIDNYLNIIIHDDLFFTKDVYTDYKNSIENYFIEYNQKLGFYFNSHAIKLFNKNLGFALANLNKDIVTDQSEFILDYGCGTGLSGYALQAVGFENIDGLDISQEMVRLAEKKLIYRSLKVFDPSKTFHRH